MKGEIERGRIRVKGQPVGPLFLSTLIYSYSFFSCFFIDVMELVVIMIIMGMVLL